MLSKNNLVKLLATTTLLLLIGLIIIYQRRAVHSTAPASLPQKKWTDEPIQPIPTEISLDAAKVALGERLFNDPQLSQENTVSCATCHNLSLGGTDQKTFSTGNKNQLGTVNSPTVFNAVYNFKQFWDGRAETLEAQVDGPTHAPDEMGSNWEEITGKLLKSPQYVAEFLSIYPNGIHPENIKDAIATFERSLITPNSRFDLFLRGNQDALTTEEKEGYRTFKSVGCISCHQGINIGGNLFQEFGVIGDYFADRGNITKADLGRYNVTHLENDKYVFKVPGLRNISRTNPYFHDGSAERLEDAVKVMSRYQLGRELSLHEVNSIVKYLKTLDGEYKRYNR